MKKTTFKENLYWNARSYGSALIIKRKTILATLTFLAVAIPFIFPVWAVPIIGKYIVKSDIIFRW